MPPSPSSASTRRGPAKGPLDTPLPEKAAAVLKSARDIFFEHGFSAATTDMIQQAAGVSKSTVYAHFPNKEAMFVAVVERECARFLEHIRQLEVSHRSIDEVLLSMARAYLDVVLSKEGLALYRVVVAEAPRLPELARRFYLAGPGAMNEMVSRVLADAARAGALDLGLAGADASAALLVNMIRGEAQMQCITHPASRPSAAQRDQWASIAVRAFLAAFRAKQ